MSWGAKICITEGCQRPEAGCAKRSSCELERKTPPRKRPAPPDTIYLSPDVLRGALLTALGKRT